MKLVASSQSSKDIYIFIVCISGLLHSLVLSPHSSVDMKKKIRTWQRVV